MIKAKFDSQNQLITGFTLSGHADSGEFGHDIVCAAVSALSISTVNGLIQVAEIDPLINQDNENGGYLSVTIKDADVDNLQVQTLLLCFENGMRDIAKQYDKYIKIK
ncbi:ribosomal-processing cysteine protease Prp [Fructilactobacillus frigidiflavus]|uniref:ribosomal-processing cysteine protease Prp n=1 Tax=Fructilactobacillus frigidiflavus TaxID=3242688 RepID=UPI00375819AB